MAQRGRDQGNKLSEYLGGPFARKSWKRLQGEVKARILWIKSHSGMKRNALADEEAGRASSASKDGDGERVANVLRFHSFSLPP